MATARRPPLVRNLFRRITRRKSRSSKENLTQRSQSPGENKGSQAHKRGPKRPKYQAPKSEHPETPQNLQNKEIHANHVEAFNSSLRRKCAAFRRKTNTYAKKQDKLQERLDTLWLVHNFLRIHFTIKKVPAVVLGILDKGLTLIQLFSIRNAF